MPKHFKSGAPNKDRGKVLRTGLALLVYLRGAGRTYEEIAGEFFVHIKTVKRMLRSLEDAGIPLVVVLDESTIPLRGGSAAHRISIDRRWKL